MEDVCSITVQTPYQSYTCLSHDVLASGSCTKARYATLGGATRKQVLLRRFARRGNHVRKSDDVRTVSVNKHGVQLPEINCHWYSYPRSIQTYKRRFIGVQLPYSYPRSIQLAYSYPRSIHTYKRRSTPARVDVVLDCIKNRVLDGESRSNTS